MPPFSSGMVTRSHQNSVWLLSLNDFKSRPSAATTATKGLASITADYGMSKKHSFEIAFYESILKKNPKYTDVIALLGELYTKTGRITDGLRMELRLVRLQPE